MRFLVHHSAFDHENEAVHAVLDRLIDRTSDRVHVIESPDADRLLDSRWYREARTTRRKLLTSALANPPRRAPDRGPHAEPFEVRDAESATVADKLAYSPLVVLVEDEESDGPFLDVLVEELGWEELRDLWQHGAAATPPAYRFASAGGLGQMPGRIRRELERAEAETRPARLFVVFDSDARWPGDQQASRGKQVRKAEEACEAAAVSFHCWAKRYAESYLPDEVIEAVRDDTESEAGRARFEAFSRLSAEERDHFPIKTRLKAVERDQALEAGLYGHLAPEDSRILEERLFPKRAKMPGTSAKSGRLLAWLIPERRESFSAAGLRRRDGRHELDEVLEKLARQL